MEIVIDLPWVPDASLAGNSRAHWKKKARLAQELRERGLEYGTLTKASLDSDAVPMTGELELEIFVWTQRKTFNGDNMLIAFKSFIDGLQEPRITPKGLITRGAGLIGDDVQITDWIIR